MGECLMRCYLTWFSLLIDVSVRRQKDDMQVNVAGIRRNIKNLAHNYSDPQVRIDHCCSYIWILLIIFIFSLNVN